MNVAIILAGGKGTRTGLPIPKQFVDVLGKPLIFYTLHIFQNHPEIDAIEIVCVEGYLDYLWKICSELQITKVRWIVKGGDTFLQSAFNGINNLRDKLQDDDIITIHTGVAPFLDPSLITHNLQICRDKGNAITSYPLYALSGKKNTLNPEMTTEYIDRDSIVCLKNPQSFKFKEIVDLYDEAVNSAIIDTVKPYITTLMFHMHKPIYLSKGNQMNIKITQKEDLKLFEAYVAMNKQLFI